jgi:hypothetical protein
MLKGKRRQRRNFEWHFYSRFLAINSSRRRLMFLSGFYPHFSVLQNATHEELEFSCFADFFERTFKTREEYLNCMEQKTRICYKIDVQEFHLRRASRGRGRGQVGRGRQWRYYDSVTKPGGALYSIHPSSCDNSTPESVSSSMFCHFFFSIV